MALNSYLEKLAVKLIPSNDEQEKISLAIKTLQDNINGYFTDIHEHFCFGSYTRGTNLPKIIDKQADIDYMLVFNKLDTTVPNHLIKRIKSFLEKYYEPNEIIQSHPTGIVDNSGVKIELIPSYREGKFFINYKIPQMSSHLEWQPTVPNEINEYLENLNVEHKEFILPVIRLIKYWNVLNDYPYSSYLLESELVKLNYPLMSSLNEYFFFAVEHLSDTALSDEGKRKLNQFKAQMDSANREEHVDLALYKLSSVLPFI